MGKGVRLREQRKKRNKELVGASEIFKVNKEVLDDESKLKMNHGYWCMGYFWSHDLVIVEPFLVVKTSKGLVIQNLKEKDMEFYEANYLLNGKDTTKYFYVDRVTALEACEAVENRNNLFEGFAGFMSDKELKEAIL